MNILVNIFRAHIVITRPTSLRRLLLLPLLFLDLVAVAVALGVGARTRRPYPSPSPSPCPPSTSSLQGRYCGSRLAARIRRVEERKIASQQFLQSTSKSIKMPRRPRRHTQHLKARPLTFSRFARSIAQMASTSKSNKKSYPSFAVSKSLTHYPGNGFAGRTLEEKTKQSEPSDEEFEGVVQADFSFFDPIPGDFHGVKNLLQTYMGDKQWDLSGFVDLILGQTTVGTVVKVEDEGLFAVVTALNLSRYREQKCIVEFKDFLLKVCKEKGTSDQLKLILGGQAHGVGLLVSQRVVNLPLQLLPHLYDALFDEVSWATEDEPTEELRNSFKFTHYIIYSKIYKHKNAEQNRKLNNDDDAIIYIKPEDELFHKLSSWFFCFPLQTSKPENRELKNYRSMGLVMAVEADKIPTFRQELRSLISEP